MSTSMATMIVPHQGQNFQWKILASPMAETYQGTESSKCTVLVWSQVQQNPLLYLYTMYKLCINYVYTMYILCIYYVYTRYILCIYIVCISIHVCVCDIDVYMVNGWNYYYTFLWRWVKSGCPRPLTVAGCIHPSFVTWGIAMWIAM